MGWVGEAVAEQEESLGFVEAGLVCVQLVGEVGASQRRVKVAVKRLQFPSAVMRNGGSSPAVAQRNVDAGAFQCPIVAVEVAVPSPISSSTLCIASRLFGWVGCFAANGAERLLG